MQILLWIFWGIAIGAATARTTIVVRIKRRLFVDDVLLILSCCCLTAGSGLLYAKLPAVYAVQGVLLNPLIFNIPPDFLETLSWFETVNFAYLSLSWTSIFSVKIAFLVFFRPLVDHLPRMIRYWKATFALTIAVFAFCFADAWITCPYTGLDAGKWFPTDIKK